MKRWIALSIVIIILAGGLLFLKRTAIDPSDFTGEWYGAEDGQLYRFHEGLIECPENTHKDRGDFGGAYFFCGDRVILFTIESDSVSQVRELYLAGEPKGEFLCESPDGTGRIVFSRSNIALQPEEFDGSE